MKLEWLLGTVLAVVVGMTLIAVLKRWSLGYQAQVVAVLLTAYLAVPMSLWATKSHYLLTQGVAVVPTNVRVHDLRHTLGRRLRAAGVSFEDRQDLLGHRSTRVTTDYSAAELRNLLDAANRVQESRRSPAMTVLRLTG